MFPSFRQISRNLRPSRLLPTKSTTTPSRPLSTSSQSLNISLQDLDPQVSQIIKSEELRQKLSINLIPSENFTSKAVLEALGSVMQNKYSEGYPKARYYGGNEFIDESEILCQQRALECYGLDPNYWGVNVQVYSGSPANFAVFTALLEPRDRIMGLDLPHGGHLSHGFQLFEPSNKKISMVSKYFETLPYRLNVETGLIDYDELEFLADRFRPKLLIGGTTAYSRLVDLERMSNIAQKVGAIRHYDMAHISGLVAAGVVPSPFEFNDVVTTTTHKSLRGPRGSMIFYRKGEKPRYEIKKKGGGVELSPIEYYDYERRINETVFPGLQGGPHNHSITALSVALKLAKQPEFIDYQKQVISNCKALENKLKNDNYELVSGGTDNHMLLIDLKKSGTGVSGAKGERICEIVNIVLNKNTVPYDKSALNPSGLRVGSPAMTSRGFVEKDFEQVGEFLHEAICIAKEIQTQAKSSKLVDFTRYIVENQPGKVVELKKKVEEFCSGFDTIGI